MPFTLIKGTFVPSAGYPDGDSIRFRPNDPNPIYRLTRRGSAPRINRRNGTIQLRFEGIDTMESRALARFSSEATESNLELCGVTDRNPEPPGYILSNQLGPNGRPISFVFAGTTNESDGDNTVYLSTDRVQESVNCKQLHRGMAYPLFYDTLFHELRETLTHVTQDARQGERGLWPADVTHSGVEYSGADSLATMGPTFPKLWRRLDKYSRDEDGSDTSNLSDFEEFLESENDRVFLLNEGRATGFDNVVKITGDRIGMTVLPEELVVFS